VPETTFPYVVVIQSDLLDAPPTRMTITLAALTFAAKVISAPCPLVMVKG